MASQQQQQQQQQQQGRPLPKFGEWDVNDPSSAEGFTVIFAKARDEKKTNNAGARASSQRSNLNNGGPAFHEAPTKKRFCCF